MCAYPEGGCVCITNRKIRTQTGNWKICLLSSPEIPYSRRHIQETNDSKKKDHPLDSGQGFKSSFCVRSGSGGIRGWRCKVLLRMYPDDIFTLPGSKSRASFHTSKLPPAEPTKNEAGVAHSATKDASDGDLGGTTSAASITAKGARFWQAAPSTREDGRIL